jgi:hypothetical protein
LALRSIGCPPTSRPVRRLGGPSGGPRCSSARVPLLHCGHRGRCVAPFLWTPAYDHRALRGDRRAKRHDRSGRVGAFALERDRAIALGELQVSDDVVDGDDRLAGRRGADGGRVLAEARGVVNVNRRRVGFAIGGAMGSTAGVQGELVRSKHPLAGFAPEMAFPAGVVSWAVCVFGVVKLTATLIGAGVGWQIALAASAVVGYGGLFIGAEALFGWLFGPLAPMWVYLAPRVNRCDTTKCRRCGRAEPTRCPRCGQHDEVPGVDVDGASGSRLARDAYRQARIVLPMSLSEQFSQTADAVIAADEVEPGDLLFVSSGPRTDVDRVVICAGRRRGRTKIIDVQGRPGRWLDPETVFTATRPVESTRVERLRGRRAFRLW